jgi:hypothetical protein
MDYKLWKSIYERIRKEFCFSLERDEEAAYVLDRKLDHKNLCSENFIRKKIKDKDVLVFGAGPNLEEILKKPTVNFSDKMLIAADGATTALLKYNILPDIIVTDLDGKPEDQIKANSENSIVVIHAHGDNIEKIKKYVPKFDGLIMGSTQVDAKNYKNLYNFGGFTDGDRAAYLAAYFNAKRIYLAAFDFNKIGKYSYTKDVEKKLLKLKWCKCLLKKLEEENNDIIYI